jgi:hypothetical protein
LIESYLLLKGRFVCFNMQLAADPDAETAFKCLIWVAPKSDKKFHF